MTMTSRRDWKFVPLAVALGAAVLVAFGRAGRWSDGIIGGALVAGLGIYLALGRSEWAMASSERGDERQSRINREATVLLYCAVITVAVVGFLWEVAQNNGPGAFTLICAVGGFTHMISVAVLRRRR